MPMFYSLLVKLETKIRCACSHILGDVEAEIAERVLPVGWHPALLGLPNERNVQLFEIVAFAEHRRGRGEAGMG